MKKLLLLVGVLAIGCDDPRHVTSQTTLVGVTIRSVNHDGHKYVVARGGEGVSILHAADCPCQKPEK